MEPLTTNEIHNTGCVVVAFTGAATIYGQSLECVITSPSTRYWYCLRRNREEMIPRKKEA